MKPVIIIAGYTKLRYLDKIRSVFNAEEVVFGCSYKRPAVSQLKQKYLSKFDKTYDLNNIEDVKKLEEETNVTLITCLQERDMEAYIETLSLCKKITPDKAIKYATAINKLTFKESIFKKYPELVPGHRFIDGNLLNNLDSLNYPQVIKPSGLAGSAMIKIVNSKEEFAKHYQNFAEHTHKVGANYYGKKIVMLTEEYISGPQYSINTYVDKQGTVTVCPIVRIVTPQELGTSDTYSALQYTTDELSTEEVSSLKTAIQKIVSHFEIKNTSAHFDIVLNNGQWKFFEVGLRIGGHRQEIYELSNNLDHLKNDVLNRLNQKIVIPEKVKDVCVVQKASVNTGILKSVSYQRTLTRNKSPLIKEDVIRKINTEVRPISEGGGTIARFFVVGNDEKEVLESGTKLFHDIILDVTESSKD